jgi:uncharacterized membrane protein
VARETAYPSARDGAFAPASLHSYPALAFLVDVPAAWAGLGSTLLVMLCGLIGLGLAIGLRLPAGLRASGWTILLANVMAILLTLRGSFEVFALLPLVLAWQWLPRRTLSSCLLGLGCAVKQVVWPLALLYLIVIARRYGPREALVRAAIAALAFIIPNAPVIVASPTAWARSLFLPFSLPSFPDGIGLVAFARAGALPLRPPGIYAALELLALGGLSLWLATTRRRIPGEALLVLGLLPLALAWRSLLAYFIWLPALTLLAALPLLRADLPGADPTGTTQDTTPQVSGT